MLPITPTLLLRPLQTNDDGALRTLLEPLRASLPDSLPASAFDVTVRHKQFLRAHPLTIFPVQWQKRQLLGAWAGGALAGFVDVATGVEHERVADPLALRNLLPVGLLRFLGLPRPASHLHALHDETAALLLGAADAFWRGEGVVRVRAHHLSTGYPALQAGAGLLPGDWAEHVRLLTSQGFRLTDRYYALRRPLQTLVEETLPLAELSVAHQHSRAGDVYELYYRRTEAVGHARLIRTETTGFPNSNGPASGQITQMPGSDTSSDTSSETSRETSRETGGGTDNEVGDGGNGNPGAATKQLAYVAEFAIQPDWQRRGVGRWLLRRLINDCTLQGYDELLVHLPQRATPALNLFNLHGFLEQDYRGYTLEKEL